MIWAVSLLSIYLITNRLSVLNQLCLLLRLTSNSRVNNPLIYPMILIKRKGMEISAIQSKIGIGIRYFIPMETNLLILSTKIDFAEYQLSPD